MCSTALKQELDQRMAGLSDESVRLIIELIDSLGLPGATARDARAPKRTANVLAGKLRYMAEDFDETPECLKEYV